MNFFTTFLDLFFLVFSSHPHYQDCDHHHQDPNHHRNSLSTLLDPGWPTIHSGTGSLKTLREKNQFAIFLKLWKKISLLFWKKLICYFFVENSENKSVLYFFANNQERHQSEWKYINLFLMQVMDERIFWGNGIITIGSVRERKMAIVVTRLEVWASPW